MPVELPLVTASGDMETATVYTVPELAALLNTSHKTVSRRVNAELWPHIRGKERRIYFTAEHVRLIVAAWNAAHDYPAHEPRKARP